MSELVLAVDGPTAPPRSNGELVFDAPWQSRVFGVTAALVETDRITWSSFQRSLIARVQAAAAAEVDDYWGCWSDALGDCCAAAGIVTAEQWEQRTAELAIRPPGHDHDHDHGHEHHHHDHHHHDERTNS